ncbi:threonine aldolase family protein [Fluviibacterium sp. S390]|uniref:threonine aldolase family protein n=1 Tax=Fluviibacterium sp. S390 TaxID=3415139 RepID=UPI003C79A322
MYFASDNAGPAHPTVLEALSRANEGYMPGYGADPLTAQVVAKIRDVFEAPDAAVYLVGTGTAANALALSVLGQPWQTVFCAEAAHVDEDECGAPEFFTGGAKLTWVDAPQGKIRPDALASALDKAGKRGVHGVQPGPLTLTQATESGTVYTLAELAELTAMARARGLPVHLDGARFANALEHLGCTPAEMTWKAGIHAVSFGGTKNGLLGVEAVIFFDPAHAWEFELRRKRGAHLFSKHRYLAAQMQAYLEGDLWRDLARRANGSARDLADRLHHVPGVEICFPVETNAVFARWPRAWHRHLLNAGAQYYLWDGTLDGGPEEALLMARLVCDWSLPPEAVTAFAAQFPT